MPREPARPCILRGWQRFLILSPTPLFLIHTAPIYLSKNALSMQTFLAKCSALAVILGGFLFTGDVAWLTQRGMRLLNAKTIPSETLRPEIISNEQSNRQAPQPPVASPAPTKAFADHVQSLPLLPSSVPATAAHAPDTLQEPPATGVISLPTDGGLECVDFSQLRIGDRVLIWVTHEVGAPSGRPAPQAVIAFDVIDPFSGEALEQRHLTAGASGTITDSHLPPRRVVIAGSGSPSPFGRAFTAAITPGKISRGHTIQLAPLNLHRGVSVLGATQSLGPVQAITVQ